MGKDKGLRVEGLFPRWDDRLRRPPEMLPEMLREQLFEILISIGTLARGSIAIHRVQAGRRGATCYLARIGSTWRGMPVTIGWRPSMKTLISLRTPNRPGR
ncbi:MAG: hypothetical protein RIS70_2703 [Planctomycetota bacterium]